MIEFLPSTDEAVEFIADNMRPADVAEVWASSSLTPLEALRESLKISEFSTVAWINGTPCVIFGLVIRDILSGDGVPWMLGANQVLDHKRDILRHTPRAIEDMLAICPKLVNYVHAENAFSIRLIKWLGFTLDEPCEYGTKNELFHRFYQVRVS